MALVNGFAFGIIPITVTEASMGKIISVVGNVGVGKTTLTRVLAAEFGWINCSEQHAERPFQAKFKQNPSYGFANQIDYLLYRAEQETEIRNGNRDGIFDGGLDMDFHVFTQLFKDNGFLDQNEFDLCKRFYFFARRSLPSPNLVIHIHANEKVVMDRFLGRNRINIATVDDVRKINILLDKYIGLSLSGSSTLQFDVSNSSLDFPEIVQKIRKSYKSL